MQIRPTITRDEIGEAIRLSRTKNFWFKFFLRNWYASLILIAVVGADAGKLLRGQAPNWTATIALLAVVVAAMGATWFLLQRRSSQILRKSVSSIETLSLDPDGVRISFNTGSSSFLPWSIYSKWAEGARIFLLTGKDGVTIIPADESSRGTIRGLLSANIR